VKRCIQITATLSAQGKSRRSAVGRARHVVVRTIRAVFAAVNQANLWPMALRLPYNDAREAGRLLARKMDTSLLERKRVDANLAHFHVSLQAQD
jgi:hypothetical protein